MIKNIIFDFGGVILKHKASITQDIISQIFPGDLAQVMVIFDKYKVDIQTGKKSSRDFLTEAKRVTGIPLSVANLHKKWSDLYKKEAQDVNWDLLELISFLRKSYKVYLFTDTIDVHDEYNNTRGLYEHFDMVFKSYKEGIAKSEGKKTFLHLLSKINANPQDCLYIDDLEKNIETAQITGMRGIVYKSLDQLKTNLQSYNIRF